MPSTCSSTNGAHLPSIVPHLFSTVISYYYHEKLIFGRGRSRLTWGGHMEPRTVLAFERFDRGPKHGNQVGKDNFNTMTLLYPAWGPSSSSGAKKTLLLGELWRSQDENQYWTSVRKQSQTYSKHYSSSLRPTGLISRELVHMGVFL